MPKLSAASPAVVGRGGPDFFLRIDGESFLPASEINFNGEKVETKFISSTVLEGAVKAKHVAVEGAYRVTVTNPGQTVLTSNAVEIQVVPAEELPAETVVLAAGPAGFGSLSGQILNTETWPIEGVTIKIGNRSARTDFNGSFRLDNVPAGKRVVLMDGSTAVEQDGHYPTIPISVDIAANTVNPMPFQPYMHRQKARNFVNIDQGRDTVLTDPEVPGFEMRIPAGVNITGWDGKRNLRVSVRTVPTDRLPVRPLPKGAFVRTVYMFYFDKVGGGVADRPIPIKSRNDLGLLPGERAILWYFDESPIEGMAPNDWAIAGTGTVTPDGKYIVADPGTGIPKFCCGATGWGATSAPNPSTGKDCNTTAGDPVDVSTGYFLHEQVDMIVPGIIPVKIKRSYRNRESGSAVSGDTGLGAFGKGTYFEYDWWLDTYDQMLLLIKPGNVQHRFDTEQPDGSWVNISDPAMRGAKVIVNADDTKVLRMRDGWRYTFNSDGGLIEIADRNDNKITVQRRSDFEGGYILTITTAEGKVVTFNQTGPMGFFRTDSITGPNGRTVNYTYENDPFSSYPRLKQVDYPDGRWIQYTYDASGRMDSFIKRNDGIAEVTNEYNTDNRVIKQTHSDGGAYTFSYSAPSGYVESTTMTAPNGAQTTWNFNTDGYIIQKVTPDGITTYTKASSTNLLDSVTDPLGRVTSYTYYVTSDVTDGLIHTMTDPIGNVTTYEYETTYGLPTKITNALGKETTFSYTFDPGTGELTHAEIRDPLLNLTAIDYDGYGMPTSITDPNSNTTTFVYDPTNYDQLENMADLLGNTVNYTYDDFGRLATVTDAGGAVTLYGYDSTEHVTSVTDPLGNVTRYAYDFSGNLTTVMDAKENLIRYEYDDRDRIVKMTDQLGREELYTYYRDLEITPTTGDNLKRITDRKGQTTSFDEYDAMGRLKKVTYGDASTTQYTYDAAGRLTQLNDSISGLIGYTYNDFGCGTCSGSGVDRIADETTAAGTVSYTYDAAGRRDSLTFPGTTDVTYSYDDAGRLTNVIRDIDGNARDFVLAYDPAGRRTSLQLTLGKVKGKWKYLTATYEYDIANRLTRLLQENPAGVVEDFLYGYDPNGNRSSVVQQVDLPMGAPMAAATYDEANEMLSADGATFNYDLNGNLETRTDACGTTTYAWDARNRLTDINGYHDDCTALSASFQYDTLGRRTEKTVDGVISQYVYDGWDIIQETTGGVTTDYARTLNVDEPLALERSDGTIRYFKADALGSIIALTDGDGVTTTTYAYDAFGNVSISGSDENPFQYTGRENDGTGLYYYRARYYSPGMRRFISEDPIGLAGGMNAFSYAENNPVGWTDPYGLWRLPDYLSLEVSAGGILGYSFMLTLDRNGNIYWSPVGANVGKTIIPVSGSFVSGWFNTIEKPNKSTLCDFLSGHSVNIDGGYIVGTGSTGWGYDAKNNSTEFGFYSPQAGMSYHYSRKINNLPISW